MKHIIAYEGKGTVALGVMQEEYVKSFLPWVNWRTGVEGTLQRPPYSHAMGIEWVRGLDKARGDHEVFAVLIKSGIKKPTYRYVGHMGVHHAHNDIPETGSLIWSADARGRGVGTEAKLLLLYHAFMVMGVRKITSNVKSFNAPSAGHLLKCGYQYVGRQRKHIFHEGAYVDRLLFEVFRENWEPIWNEYQQSAALPKLSAEQRAFLTEEARNK